MQADKEAGDQFYAVFSERLRQLRTGQGMPWTRISSLTGLDIRDLIRMEEGRPFLYSKYRQFMDGLELTFAELSPVGLYSTDPFPEVGSVTWGADIAHMLQSLSPFLPGMVKCNDQITAFRRSHNMLDEAEKAGIRRKPVMLELGQYLKTCCMVRNVNITDFHERLDMKPHTLALISHGLRDPSMGTLAQIGSCLRSPIDCVAPTKAAPSAQFARALIANHIDTLAELADFAVRISAITDKIETLMSRSHPFGTDPDK